MTSPLPFVISQAFQEIRDFGSVDVVSATFTLRLQHISSGPGRRSGDGNGLLAGIASVEWVNGRKGGLDTRDRRLEIFILKVNCFGSGKEAL